MEKKKKQSDRHAQKCAREELVYTVSTISTQVKSWKNTVVEWQLFGFKGHEVDKGAARHRREDFVLFV